MKMGSIHLLVQLLLLQISSLNNNNNYNISKIIKCKSLRIIITNLTLILQVTAT